MEKDLTALVAFLCASINTALPTQVSAHKQTDHFLLRGNKPDLLPLCFLLPSSCPQRAKSHFRWAHCDFSRTRAGTWDSSFSLPITHRPPHISKCDDFIDLTPQKTVCMRRAYHTHFCFLPQPGSWNPSSSSSYRRELIFITTF